MTIQEEQLKQDELVRIGAEAEQLLDNPAFNSTVNNLVDQAFQAFCNSKPEQSTERERSYHHYRALVDIVSTLQQRVAVRDQIVASRQQQSRGEGPLSNVQDQTSITKALRDDEVSDAILSRWEDAGDDQLSEDGEEASQQVEEETDDDVDLVEVDETEEDIEEDTEPEEEDDANEDNDDEDELDSQFADDDAMVEVTVDGKVVQQSVKELKRLAGQEASLTRKSQETASKRKEADEAINKNHAVFQTLLAKAEEKYKPYSEVDMLLASKTMEAEDFALLRKEAQDAETN